MSLYGVVLLAHSWFRWAVLLLGVVVLARGWRSWKGSGLPPRILHAAFLVALYVQATLGLLLYVTLSPIPAAAFQDMGAAMDDAVLRFYSVEHVFGMVVALIAAHVAFAVGRTEEDGAPGRSRRLFLAQAVWLLVTLGSIPWPGLAYGRELFRLGW